MKLSYIFKLLPLMAICLASCGKEDGPDTPPQPVPDPKPEKMEIRISAGIGATKATDAGFESGDCIGLYIVNRSGNGANTLRPSGNHVDNMRFTLSSSWNPDSPIYWEDNDTHADFYIYYPYRKISDANNVEIETKTDQSSEADYKSSDFMTGMRSDVAPTQSEVSLTANHLLSRVNIGVKSGDGFTDKALSEADLKVRVNGVYTKANVNLATSELKTSGNRNSILAYRNEDSFKAIVIPQSVDYGKLITVSVNGQEYSFTKEFTFERAKEHNFTITVSKSSNGINVNISPWVNDGTDNGGTAE